MASVNTCAPSTRSSSDGVLAPVMADAADRRHEHHRGGQLAREPLRVVAGAARHADVLARRVALGRRIERRHQPLVHLGRRRLRDHVDLELAAARRGSPPRPACGARPAAGRAPPDRRRATGTATSALPGMMLWLPGSSVMRPVVHTVRGPQISGKRLSIADEQPHQRKPRVAPPRHRGGAGVVLLAGRRERILPDRHDRRDDADAQLLAFQRVALLDMRLEERLVARRLDRRRAGARSSRPWSAPRASACRRGGSPPCRCPRP